MKKPIRWSNSHSPLLSTEDHVDLETGLQGAVPGSSWIQVRQESLWEKRELHGSSHSILTSLVYPDRIEDSGLTGLAW